MQTREPTGARRSVVSRWPLASFTVLACALSWSWWLPLAATGTAPQPGAAWPTHLPGLLGPAIAAVVVTAVCDGRTGLARLGRTVVRWRVPRRGWVVVLATLALTPLIALALSLSGRPVPVLADFSRYNGIGQVGLAGVVLIAFVVNGLGEETGWRGFAADRLLLRHGLTGTAVRVAVLWGVWHTAYNLGAATEASAGLGAAVLSTLVMLAAAVVAWRERRATLRRA